MVLKQEPFSNITELKLLQPLKEEAPIVSQEAGIVIVFNDWQIANAEEEIVFKPEPFSNDTEFKLLQRSKADAPIVSQETGIRTSLIDVQ